MNNNLPVTLQLEVPRYVKEIRAFTQRIVALVLANIVLSSAEISKVKMIIVELTTNSIKHDLGGQAEIKLLIDRSILTIQKVHKGGMLTFSSSEQFPFNSVGKVLGISFSDENRHDIKILDAYKFQFLERTVVPLSIADVPEHFGLHIMVAASDIFTYEYCPIMNENKFTVEFYVGELKPRYS